MLKRYRKFLDKYAIVTRIKIKSVIIVLISIYDRQIDIKEDNRRNIYDNNYSFCFQTVHAERSERWTAR